MNRDRFVYLDYAATTPVRPEVVRAMEPFWSDAYGNPSSAHRAGRAARAALEEARGRLARALRADRDDIVFVAGGSESDNLAVLGFARRHAPARILHSAIEHKAVLKAARAAGGGGAQVESLPVDERGVLRLDALEEALGRGDGRPALVSVMWVNNETGVVQPVAEVARICRRHGAVFHTDAAQAFGRLPVAVDDPPVDLLSLSAHKIGGPKGVGALYVRGGVEVEPIVYGGGHERGLRSGTQAVPLAVGFAEAAEIAVAALEDEARRLGALRDRLEEGLRSEVPDLQVNGAGAPRVPSVLNVSIAGVALDVLLTALDLEGIGVSSGSACTTGAVEPSHVAVAMGRTGGWAENTIRMSLGWATEPSDIDHTLGAFPRVVARVREMAAAG